MKRVVKRAAVAWLFVACAAACGASSSASKTASSPPTVVSGRSGGLTAAELRAIGSGDPPSLFVAEWRRGRPDLGQRASAGIGLFRTRDAKLVRTLIALPAQNGVDVAGLSLGGDGSVWWSVASGPYVRNNTAGGDPAPNSCHSTIYRLGPEATSPLVVVQGRPDELLTEPAPSPDGTRLAFRRGLCLWYGSASSIRVRDLHDGTTIEIGRGALPCSGLSTPSWNARSSQVLISASLAPAHATGTPGVCEQPPPPLLVVAQTDRSSDFPGGRLIHAQPASCWLSRGAFRDSDIVAVQVCGSIVDAPKQIVALDSHGNPLAQYKAPGPTQPGLISLSPSPNGRHVLVTTMLDGEADGTTVLEDLHDGQLTTIARLNDHLEADTTFLFSAAHW